MLQTNYRHKYNPNEIDKKTFLANFVVRQEIFDEIFDDIKRTDFSVPSQHTVIIGQRGQGKTTLLRKLNIEIEEDKQLSQFMISIQFAEEQYQIRSLCSLWELIAEMLEEADDVLFSNIVDIMEQHLEDKDYEFNCFDYLEKEIKKHNKKVVLLIDNIDELFGKLKEKETKKLREILLTSSTFKIIGGSTKMFENHYDYSKEFYQFFKIIKLKGLSQDETIKFLTVVANDKQKVKIADIIKNQKGKIETLRQLTGGVPRTLVMLFDIFMDEEGSAFDDLIKVIDEATPLYKHRMDDLPPVLQDIVHNIALNWDGILTKDIAKKTRLTSKEVSAQLKQLEKYQVVESVSIGKNNIYKIEERFFNIWYLMRFGRKKDRNRVEWLVRFLSTWYTKEELENKCIQLIKATKNNKIKEHYLYHMSEALSYTGLLDIKTEFILNKNTKEHLEKIQSKYIKDISPSGIELLKESFQFYHDGQLNEAIKILEKSKKSSNEINKALKNFKILYNAEKLCFESIKSGDNSAFSNLAWQYFKRNDFPIAKKYYMKAIEYGDNDALIDLGVLYSEEKEYEKAEYYYLKAMETENNYALIFLTLLYFEQSKNSKLSLELIQKSYDVNKEYINTHTLATILLWNEEFSKSYEKFEEWMEFEGALESLNDISEYLNLLIAKGQYYKAKEYFENEKYQLKDKLKPIWYALMTLMQDEFPNEIKKMGSELQTSVDDIVKRIAELEQKYKI